MLAPWLELDGVRDQAAAMSDRAHLDLIVLGTTAGAVIPDGSGGFVKDERGAVVLSKLNSSTLQEITTATNGVYRDASTWVDLGAVLKQTVESGRRGEELPAHALVEDADDVARGVELDQISPVFERGRGRLP